MTMKTPPFVPPQSRSQSYDGSSYSNSSGGSGFSRNTWSSSNRGLIQIGSFKFANSDQDDLSMGDDSIHRFSVIIHDNTDTESLAAASSRQIENLHGQEDPNVMSKSGRGSKIYGRPKPVVQSKGDSSIASSKKSSPFSVLQKPNRVTKAVEADPFDHLCNAFEGFVCRKGADETVKVGTKVEEKQETSTEPSPAPPLLMKENPIIEDRDALDTVFEGVESMTCGPEARKYQKEKRLPKPIPEESNEAEPQDTRDVIDRVFDGVEIMTCGPDSSHREAFKKFGPVRTKTNSRWSQRSSGYEADILDHTCESVEHYSCRLDATNPRFSEERDFLDNVFDGVETVTCSQKTPKRGNMTKKGTPGSAERPIRVPLETQKIKKIPSEDDVLDSICNGVEYAVCRNEAVELHQSNKRDLLDHVIEPDFEESQDGYSSNNENSMVASTESEAESSCVDEHREMPDTAIKEDGDMLDYIFETVESKTCRPSSDDLSTVNTKSVSKRGGNKLFGKFRFCKT